MRAMSNRSTAAAIVVFLLAILTPNVARADGTLFFGKTTSPVHRSVRGFAVGMSLLIIGFEFEISTMPEDREELRPSVRTTSGNVFVQTPSISGFQFYATTGPGYYREQLDADDETGFVMNTGGGVKVKLAGPLRLRVDYRVFNFRGSPEHATMQRVYAGLNLGF
jgi:hypothetical protein